MATIQTVTGPIDSSELGFTLMHEHVRVGWGAMFEQYPQMFDRDQDRARAVEKLTVAKAAGVQSMVDLTPIDLARDVRLMADVSRESGVQIIAATGFYYSIPFHFLAWPDEAMTELFVRDLTQGISETGIRAGVIKCATQEEMHPANERVLRASAKAAQEAGAPICTHTHPASRTGLDQQRVFKEEGLDLGKCVIGHSDDSDSIDYLDEIIQNGSFCGMDRFGIQSPRTTEQRAEMVALLVERGYANRITLSHDHCCTFHWGPPGIMEQFAPQSKLTHISEDVVPMLRTMGVSDANITQMTTGNPRALFEHAAS
jgi:phosphotriesterase-related protein